MLNPFQSSHCDLFLQVGWHAATLFVYFLLKTFVHTLVQYIYPSHLLSSPLFFLIAVRSVEGLHWGVEPRIELGTTFQQIARRATV
jgi:hypothetical protein